MLEAEIEYEKYLTVSCADLYGFAAKLIDHAHSNIERQLTEGQIRATSGP